MKLKLNHRQLLWTSFIGFFHIFYNYNKRMSGQAETIVEFAFLFFKTVKIANQSGLTIVGIGARIKKGNILLPSKQPFLFTAFLQLHLMA